MGFARDFFTPPKAQTEGVRFYTPDKQEWFYVAMIGTRNVEYRKSIEAFGKMPDEGDQEGWEAYGKNSIEAFKKHCVKGWGSVAHGEGAIEGADGKPFKFTPKNASTFLEDAQGLLIDLMNFSRDQNNYLLKNVEEDAKN